MIEQSGTYKAKAKKARIIKSGNKGTLGIEVVFETEDPISDISYVGWLSERAIEYTMKTLTGVMESDGKEEVDQDGNFVSPTFINYDKTYNLVVEMEEGKDKDGNVKIDKLGLPKMYPVLKWVNEVGGSNYAGLEPEVAKTALKSVGFKAAFLAAKAGNKTSLKENTDEIPF